MANLKNNIFYSVVSACKPSWTSNGGNTYYPVHITDSTGWKFEINSNIECNVGDCIEVEVRSYKYRPVFHVLRVVDSSDTEF